jgi:hypothetical protein
MNQHLPINLAVMGVKGCPERGADLKTIWLTPYPVITTYRKVCEATGLDCLGKSGRISARGRMLPIFYQGDHTDGYILSGYRSEVINGNAGSMHRYAMALDVEVHSVDKQFDVGIEALKQGFTRIGFYPDRKFMHWDMAPDNWIERFAKRRFWVEVDGTKQSFSKIDHAIEFMTGT